MFDECHTSYKRYYANKVLKVRNFVNTHIHNAAQVRHMQKMYYIVSFRYGSEVVG